MREMKYLNSSVLLHTVDGVLLHTVRNAIESLTVCFYIPSRAFSSFPTVCFYTPYIEYAIHSGSSKVSFFSLKRSLKRERLQTGAMK